MNNKQNLYLAAMGISVWQLKKSKNKPQPSWETLQNTVAQCRACGLERSRTQTVFGVGNRKAEFMIIGEAPGFYEDQQGEPFVGRAGQLLTAMLKAIQLDRSQVFIANILKCRPPNNRDPQPEEVAQCTPFLEQQLNLIQPKLLLAVGRIAAHYLLNSKQPLSQLRGKVHRYGKNQTPLIVTYHPAYLLRNPRDKAQAWEDWLLAQEKLSTTEYDNNPKLAQDAAQ